MVVISRNNCEDVNSFLLELLLMCCDNGCGDVPNGEKGKGDSTGSLLKRVGRLGVVVEGVAAMF